MSGAVTVTFQVPRHFARALLTLCNRLDSDRSRQIAAEHAEAIDAIKAAESLRLALVLALVPQQGETA